MKNPKYLRKNVFIVYSPKLKLNQLLPAKSTQNWSCFYQKEQNLFHLSSKGTIFSVEKQHLWVEILNKSFEEQLKFDRSSPLGFVVIGPEYLKVNHETQTTTKKK